MNLKKILTILLLAVASISHAESLSSVSAVDARSGIKEALTQGVNSAVTSLGKKNGFLDNENVRISLPDSLKKLEKTMRTLGMGKQTDELVLAMNHAAENAVAETKPILLDSIKKMSVSDAKGILTGGEDSVTQYFKRTSSSALAQKFLPIVKDATRKVQLSAQYSKVADKAARLGLIDKKDADLDGYVTEKAMDGLFKMLAEQEKKLRANPLEAGSRLLKMVFGAL